MLLLVRHGETEYNLPPERMRGWLDIPLTLHGQQEAHELAADLCKRSIAYVASSDFMRDMETGRIIAQVCGAYQHVDQRFRPWNIGLLAGQLRSDVEDVITWLIKNPQQEPPQGEAFAEFYQRWRNSFWNLVADAQRDPSQDVLAVIHGTEIRSMDALLNDDDLTKIRAWKPVSPGDVVMVDL